uniref:Cadherin domain-containing protein n=1 Tax=Timema douglasi TaxID=61478 RepID=A0A7R8VJT2_TIMDO|nr:unnamed protein product [Timema douglasi]
MLQVQASQVDNPLKTGVARVEVELLDLNDNLPQFEVQLYNISIVENLPNGFSVLHVSAVDKDQILKVLLRSSRACRDPQGFVAILKGLSRSSRSCCDPQGLVAILKGLLRSLRACRDPQGLVAILKGLSRSSRVLLRSSRACRDPQGFVAILKGLSRSSRSCCDPQGLVAILKGKGSEVPDFLGSPYEFWVGDNVPVGTSVGQMRVTGAVDKNKVIYDMLHSYHDGGESRGCERDYLVTGRSELGSLPFAVEERSGTITVVDDISRFEPVLYDFEAVATDGSDVTLVTNVTIHVVELDRMGGSERDKVATAPIQFRVRENLSGALVGQLLNHTVPGGRNSSAEGGRWRNLRFTIANQQDVADKFAVSQDGTLYTQRGLDREEREDYRLTLIAENNRGVVRGAGVYQVNVLVEDENDNPPVFDRSSYEGRIQENSPSGSEVKLDHPIKASDADLGGNAQFTFTLHGEGSELFSVEQPTGRVYLRAGTLDREEKTIYLLRVVARDKGRNNQHIKRLYLGMVSRDKGCFLRLISGNLNSEVKLTIYVDDVNDNAPTFLQMVSLLDQDVEISGPQGASSDPNSTLAPRVVTTNFTDHDDALYAAPLVTVSENTPVGMPILRLLAGDRDAGSNATVTYGIPLETYVTNKILLPPIASSKNHFSIHPTTGEVSVARVLPPETEFLLNVTAVDGGGATGNVSIRIYVRDVNDHAPVFKKSWYSFNLKEGYYASHPIGVVKATDQDHGDNAKVSYVIVQSGGDFPPLPFRISEDNGTLSVTGNVDRETRDSYSFQVMAQDGGPIKDRKRSVVDVEVNVLDVNDNAPSFYNYDHILQKFSRAEEGSHALENPLLVPIYYASVLENSPPGTVVSKVSANDSDFPGNGNGLLLFNIPYGSDGGDVFAVDSKEGIIRTVGKLDFETQASYNVSVVASDLGNPSLSSTAVLSVSVVDVHEEEEEASGEIRRPMFAHRYYEVEVEENSAPMTPLVDLNVTETYRKLNLKFSLVPTPGSDSFRIQPRNGTLYVVKSLDRETTDKYELRVRVDNVKKGRGMPVLLYPLPTHRLADLGEDSYSRSTFKKGLEETRVKERWIEPYMAVTMKRRTQFTLYIAATGQRGTGYLLKYSSPMASLVLTDSSQLTSDSQHLAANEVKVIVRVKDVNDNTPRFIVNGRPIVAAIPTTANYGYQIVKLQVSVRALKGYRQRGAVDADEGLNADVRYQILGRADDESRKFTVDPLTGQVRSIVSFSRDAGRVFGFDVKATDKRGADDGRSSITNVFVYVLDDQKQLIMVVGSKPTLVEKNLENITLALFNITGLDVRVRRIEPHIERDGSDNAATDLYLYGVDPLMNIIIDMDTLQSVLHSKKSEISRKLASLHMLEITSGLPTLTKPSTQRHLLSSLEVGVVVLGCVVFVGALAAAICVGCVRRSKNRNEQETNLNKGYQFTISNPTNPILSGHTKARLFPNSYMDTMGGCGGGDTTDTYVDMHSNKSNNFRDPRHNNYHHRHHHKHDANCGRYQRRRSHRVLNGLETSMTSLHSSKDSGIADHGRCVCGHSTSPSSGDSSNGSYEDSLKSLQRKQSAAVAAGVVTELHTATIARRGGNQPPSRRRHQRNSSVGSGVHKVCDPQVPQTAPVNIMARRPSERRVSHCSLVTS